MKHFLCLIIRFTYEFLDALSKNPLKFAEALFKCPAWFWQDLKRSSSDLQKKLSSVD